MIQRQILTIIIIIIILTVAVRNLAKFWNTSLNHKFTRLSWLLFGTRVPSKKWSMKRPIRQGAHRSVCHMTRWIGSDLDWNRGSFNCWFNLRTRHRSTLRAPEQRRRTRRRRGKHEQIIPKFFFLDFFFFSFTYSSPSRPLPTKTYNWDT